MEMNLIGLLVLGAFILVERLFFHDWVKLDKKKSQQDLDLRFMIYEDVMKGVYSQMKNQNEELLSEIGLKYEKQLDKLQNERDEAMNVVSIQTSAIKSLEPKYRTKIQYQIDRIIDKQKKKPAVSDKGKPGAKNEKG